MGLAFFGLTLNDAPIIRINLFKQLHSIIFHSKGAYDFYTIYNLPIWLRKFVFKEIDDYYKEEQKAYESSTKGKNTSNLVNTDGTVNAPEFLKASKPYKGKTSYK